MKVLVTGASGYIGAAVADVLRKGGHEVVGLARSELSAASLRARGLSAARGDFKTVSTVLRAIDGTRPDAIISTAGVAGLVAEDFKRTRDTLIAITRHWGGGGKLLIFTSGSAVFGVFAAGEQSAGIYAEDTQLPLPRDTVSPVGAGVPAWALRGFQSAVATRIATEQAVLTATGLRGMVVRPGNVWGRGGSFDLPAQMRMARKNGVAPHFGPGGTTHGYVHIDDVAQLFRLALERGNAGDIFHGISEEASQREVAAAISRMMGLGDRTAGISLPRMLALGGPTGLSLSINKRLAAEHTRARLCWKPERLGVLRDIEFGSYSVAPPSA